MAIGCLKFKLKSVFIRVGYDVELITQCVECVKILQLRLFFTPFLLCCGVFFHLIGKVFFNNPEVGLQLGRRVRIPDLRHAC